MSNRTFIQGFRKTSSLRIVPFFLIVALFMGPIILSCCGYHPWKVERYVNEKTDKIYPESTTPDKSEFSEFYIDNNFVYVFLRGKDETMHSGKGPYGFHIAIWKIGIEGRDDRLCLKEIKVHSSLGKPHDFVLSNQFPVILDFKKVTYYNQVEHAVEVNNNLTFASAKSQEPLHLDFDGGEIVVIELIFELVRPDSTSLQKTIRYEFKPKLEEGNFIWITA